jgi:hypothetical protein
MLKEGAHTQKMSEAAVGLGTDNRRHRDREDEQNNEMMEDV